MLQHLKKDVQKRKKDFEVENATASVALRNVSGLKSSPTETEQYIYMLTNPNTVNL